VEGLVDLEEMLDSNDKKLLISSSRLLAQLEIL
jgi:hypothetical protein